MLVKFIAHAGFYLEQDGFSLCLDPWLISSTFDEPVLKSILPPFKTIDFQAPQTPFKVTDFQPNAILLSHFHTHHSPMKELRHWISKAEKTMLMFPALEATTKEKIGNSLGELLPRSELIAVNGAEPYRLGPFEITGFYHTEPGHMGWIIRSSHGTVLHLADAIMNTNALSRQIDEKWKRFADLKPDLFFLSCNATNTRHVRPDGTRYIHENSILSPVEAARLAALIRPRVIAPMGAYNNSLWKDREESSMPAGDMEAQLHWALNWLAPEITMTVLKPGGAFNVENGRIQYSPGSAVSL